MAQLRESTRDLQEQLGRDDRITGKFRTRRGLGELLGRWYGFFVPFEATLSLVSPRWKSLVEERRKVPLLRADLEAHGIAEECAPLCANLPIIRDESELLGAMYVTECSTLSARFVARQLESKLSLHDGVGYSFFLGYREHTGRMWREFGSIVDTVCAGSPSKAVGVSRQTFTTIHEWLVSA